MDISNRACFDISFAISKAQQVFARRDKQSVANSRPQEAQDNREGRCVSEDRALVLVGHYRLDVHPQPQELVHHRQQKCRVCQEQLWYALKTVIRQNMKPTRKQYMFDNG